jgi:hypothetical protein
MFSEAPGSFEICPICFWEDDIVQLGFPDLAGGANKCSLIEGQRNFALFGACEARLKEHVRVPLDSDVRDPAWRPLVPECDRFLSWGRREDHDLWQQAKHSEALCLYYWMQEYWLRGRRV